MSTLKELMAAMQVPSYEKRSLASGEHLGRREGRNTLMAWRGPISSSVVMNRTHRNSGAALFEAKSC